MRPHVCWLFILILFSTDALAQRTQYDQEAVGQLLDRQGEGRLPSERIEYETIVIDHPRENSIYARHELYKTVGGGDVHRGRDRLALTLLLNNVLTSDLRLGDSIVLPARPEHFDLDPRAYAPFPLTYEGAADIGKLVVVDKDAQAWAAYQHGELLRWGPASTGAEGTPTPTGRFYMNWRQMERESSESPPGEVWRMRYVMNIHNARGIHLHQYDSVPSGPPVGKGCIRMIMADAKWLWDWSDPWVTTAGSGALGGQLKQNGTMVIVQGDEPTGSPRRFTQTREGTERVVVSLPPDPTAVPRGDR